MGVTVIHGMDFGRVLKHRLVDEAWQYETLVRWSGCFCCGGTTEWIPTIELGFLR